MPVPYIMWVISWNTFFVSAVRKAGTVSHDAEPHPETNEIRQSNFMAGKKYYDNTLV